VIPVIREQTVSVDQARRLCARPSPGSILGRITFGIGRRAQPGRSGALRFLGGEENRQRRHPKSDQTAPAGSRVAAPRSDSIWLRLGIHRTPSDRTSQLPADRASRAPSRAQGFRSGGAEPAGIARVAASGASRANRSVGGQVRIEKLASVVDQSVQEIPVPCASAYLSVRPLLLGVRDASHREIRRWPRGMVSRQADMPLPPVQSGRIRPCGVAQPRKPTSLWRGATDIL